MKYLPVCLLMLLLTAAGCSKKTTAVPEKPANAVVVVNSEGKVVAMQGSIPAENTAQLNKYRTMPLAFTPNQRKNLTYRFKTVPPRILYVPDALAKSGGRGSYYVYKTKFWYWKSADGFYHLDETYYK
jgi:hypothetical protein